MIRLLSGASASLLMQPRQSTDVSVVLSNAVLLALTRGTCMPQVMLLVCMTRYHLRLLCRHVLAQNSSTGRVCFQTLVNVTQQLLQDTITAVCVLLTLHD